KLDRARGVTLLPRSRDEVVADVHLAAAQPRAIHVVVDPAHEPAAGPDAGDGVGRVRTRTEPPVELVVTALDEQARVTKPGSLQRHDAVGCARSHAYGEIAPPTAPELDAGGGDHEVGREAEQDPGHEQPGDEHRVAVLAI